MNSQQVTPKIFENCRHLFLRQGRWLDFRLFLFHPLTLVPQPALPPSDGAARSDISFVFPEFFFVENEFISCKFANPWSQCLARLKTDKTGNVAACRGGNLSFRDSTATWSTCTCQSRTSRTLLRRTPALKVSRQRGPRDEKSWSSTQSNNIQPLRRSTLHPGYLLCFPCFVTLSAYPIWRRNVSDMA